MKKLVLSLLLLVTATFMSRVFAQSAEEAAKYGQLQEIQLPQAGKLGKFIKKADPNVTALKISGELNAKDWEILFSLPNVAYLDLWNVKNTAQTFEWKEGKEKKSVALISGSRIYTPLMNLPNLKYYIVPSTTDGIYALEIWCYLKEIMPKSKKNTDELPVALKVRDLDVVVTNSKGAGMTMASKLRVKEPFGSNLMASVYQNYTGGTETKELYLDYDCDIAQVSQDMNIEYFLKPEIVILSNGQKILYHYNSPEKVVDLSSYSAVMTKAFANTDVEEVNFGKNITEIPDGCFLNCKYLQKLTMPKVIHIGNYAFTGTENLHDIKVNPEAESFNLGSLVCSGIKKVDLTAFPYAPELIADLGESRRSFDGNELNCYQEWDNVTKDIEFYIPAGARGHRYNVGTWKELRVVEYGANDTYTFQLDSVGSLKNFITDENALNIRKLTLRGVMDETEFELIKKCKYLKYLDMTNCFTFASVEVAKGKVAANIFLMQLMSLGSTMDKEKKEQQYAHYETTYDEMQKAQIRDNFIKSLGVDDIKMEDLDAVFGHGKVIVSDECYFPEGSFEGLTELEEIHFPNKLLKLERKHLYYLRGASERYKTYIKHLKKVRVSNELHTLGDYLFANSQLEDINIPDSLQHVGYFCFKNCKLKKVDLSNTNISTYHFYTTNQYPDWETYIGETKSIGLPLYVFLGNPLAELRLPKKLTKAEWIGDKLSDNNTTYSNEIVMYVYFKEPFCKVGQFEEAYGKIKELHIPRGMKAAWRGYPNLIDDIDL